MHTLTRASESGHGIQRPELDDAIRIDAVSNGTFTVTLHTQADEVRR